MDDTKTIVVPYRVVGERQPIIRSWRGLGFLVILVLLRLWYVMAAHH